MASIFNLLTLYVNSTLTSCFSNLLLLFYSTTSATCGRAYGISIMVDTLYIPCNCYVGMSTACGHACTRYEVYKVRVELTYNVKRLNIDANIWLLLCTLHILYPTTSATCGRAYGISIMVDTLYIPCNCYVGMSTACGHACTRYKVYKVRAIYCHFQTCYLNFVVSSSPAILISSRRCIL